MRIEVKSKRRSVNCSCRTRYRPTPRIRRPRLQSASLWLGRATSAWRIKALDYTERLRRLAFSDAGFGEDAVRGAAFEELDAKTLALVRLAALVAVDSAIPSYGMQADVALGAGATVVEIVDVLVAVVPIVGLPRVVAAAPKLAIALGYDTDEAMRPPSAW